MNTTSKLLLTAVVSLATGAGATYATVSITATCSPRPLQSDHVATDNFMRGAPPSPRGGTTYGPDVLK